MFLLIRVIKAEKYVLRIIQIVKCLYLLLIKLMEKLKFKFNWGNKCSIPDCPWLKAKKYSSHFGSSFVFFKTIFLLRIIFLFILQKNSRN